MSHPTRNSVVAAIETENTEAMRGAILDAWVATSPLPPEMTPLSLLIILRLLEVCPHERLLTLLRDDIVATADCEDDSKARVLYTECMRQFQEMAKMWSEFHEAWRGSQEEECSSPRIIH